MIPTSFLRHLQAALIASAALVTGGCSQPALPESATAATVRRVELIKPETRAIRRSTDQPGQIEADEVTPIHAKVAGYVERWTADIGTHVKKGAVLATLNVPELDAETLEMQAKVEEAQAALSQANANEQVAVANIATAQAKLVESRASILRVQADVDRWQSEFQRVQQLFNERAQTGTLLDETSSKLKSSLALREETNAQIKTVESAVQQSRALLEKSRSDVAAAAAGIKVARFAADRAAALKSYTLIVAPYDGTIIERHINAGDLTQAGTQGHPLFVISHIETVRIVVNVPEMIATTVQSGDEAIVQIQALANKKIHAQVTRTARSLDHKNRTLRVEIDLPNHDRSLTPGLYVTATVIADDHPNARCLPLTAILRQEGVAYSFTVVDGKAHRKPLSLGLIDDTHAEILAGLEPTDTVVKEGVASLTEGQPVALISADSIKAKP